MQIRPVRQRTTGKKNWTAIVIEGGESTAEPWTKPDGLNVDSFAPDGFVQPGENNVLMINAAFKPRIVKRRPENLSSVCTANAGETMTRKDLINSPLLGR